MPNILIIGAAKSGTSALWRYLPQHPDIFMSPKKEPHFFAYENSTPDAQGPGDHTKYAKTDLDSYCALFDGVKNESAIGEAATTSLYMPIAVERIKYYIPEAKFIAILRQPADRAFSSYMNLIRDHREPVQEFAEALKLEEERISCHWGFMWHYTRVGYYYEQLKRFFGRFDKDQIRVFLHDEFNDNPVPILQDIFNFLEVDDGFMPDMRVRANVSGIQKSKVVEHLTGILFDRPNPLRFLARRAFSEEGRWRFTTTVRDRNLAPQTLPPSFRQVLTERFRDDILKLQELIDRDLTHWLETP
jgi:hypothetical protein